MNKKVMVSFKLNGKETDVVVEPRELLIHTLREKCLHTGPHIGCETSHCGACTVDFDGMSVKSCTMLTVQAEGAEVLTVEGLAQGGELHALQEGFMQEHGLQCGFCTPGMLMRAYRLLQENPDPSEEEIRPWFDAVCELWDDADEYAAAARVARDTAERLYSERVLRQRYRDYFESLGPGSRLFE